MTTTDLAVTTTRQTVQLNTEQIKYIANTELIPKDKRGNIPAIMAAVITARELGLGDMFGINHILVIDGSVSYSAVLASYLIRRAGHSLTKEDGEGWVTAHGKRRDNGDEISVRWDMDKAAKAKLIRAGGAWEKYPQSMLWARAVTQLSRELFADVFAGDIYSPEELGVEDMPQPEPAYEDGDDDQPVDDSDGLEAVRPEPDANQLEIVDA